MGPWDGSLYVKDPDLWQALLQVKGILNLLMAGLSRTALLFVGTNIHTDIPTAHAQLL